MGQCGIRHPWEEINAGVKKNSVNVLGIMAADVEVGALYWIYYIYK